FAVLRITRCFSCAALAGAAVGVARGNTLTIGEITVAQVFALVLRAFTVGLRHGLAQAIFGSAVSHRTATNGRLAIGLIFSDAGSPFSMTTTVGRAQRMGSAAIGVVLRHAGITFEITECRPLALRRVTAVRVGGRETRVANFGARPVVDARRRSGAVGVTCHDARAVADAAPAFQATAAARLAVFGARGGATDVFSVGPKRTQSALQAFAETLRIGRPRSCTRVHDVRVVGIGGVRFARGIRRRSRLRWLALGTRPRVLHTTRYPIPLTR